MLKYAYSFPKFGVDTTKNGPLKACEKFEQSSKRLRTNIAPDCPKFARGETAGLRDRALPWAPIFRTPECDKLAREERRGEGSTFGSRKDFLDLSLI